MCANVDFPTASVGRLPSALPPSCCCCGDGVDDGDGILPPAAPAAEEVGGRGAGKNIEADPGSDTGIDGIVVVVAGAIPVLLLVLLVLVLVLILSLLVSSLPPIPSPPPMDLRVCVCVCVSVCVSDARKGSRREPVCPWVCGQSPVSPFAWLQMGSVVAVCVIWIEVEGECK